MLKARRARVLTAVGVAMIAAAGVWPGSGGAIPRQQETVETEVTLTITMQPRLIPPCVDADPGKSCRYKMALKVKVEADRVECRRRTVKIRVVRPASAQGNFDTYTTGGKGKAKQSFYITAYLPRRDGEPFVKGGTTVVRAIATGKSFATAGETVTCERDRSPDTNIVVPTS